MTALRKAALEADSAPAAPTRAQGRPKDLAKRGAILEAARKHFMSHGYDRASMDAIAQAARVSKLTVYGHFGSKDELFKCVIEQECTRHMPRDNTPTLLKLPVREALLTVATRFLDMILKPENVKMHRLMVAEALEKPMISKLFYEAGPERVKQDFITFLTALQARGDLNVPDPERAAGHFFCLLKGSIHCQAVLNLGPKRDRQALQEHAADVVDLFLRAYK